MMSVAFVKGRRAIEWANDHKREIFVAGVGIVVAVLCFKNRARIKGAFISLFKGPATHVIASSPVDIQAATETAKEVVSQATVSGVKSAQAAANPIEVSKHIRNLPKGWSPSMEKVRTAAENGFNLQARQTWVDNYVKNAVAA